jgi:hypothetical protein
MTIEETPQTTPEKSEVLVSPLFFFICILTTMAFLILLVYRWTSYFTPNEKPAPLHYLTTEKRKEFGGDPATVKVGLYINDFYKFDMNNDEFIFNGILTYEFDPSLISLRTIDSASFDRGDILYSSPATTYLKNSRMFARYDMRVKVSSNLDYAWFPFEDHRLSILLIDKTLTPTDLIFQTSDATFTAPDMNAVGWHKFGSKAEAGYLDAPLGHGQIQYPAVLFTVDYGRYINVRNIVTIMFPMLLLFFVALFSLILDPKDNFTYVLTIPVQTIAGLIAFRFVIESISPKVGYFMYSDYFFFFFLFLMFSILLFHTIGSNLGSFPRKVAIIIFNIIIALVLLYFLSSAAPFVTWT